MGKGAKQREASFFLLVYSHFPVSIENDQMLSRVQVFGVKKVEEPIFRFLLFTQFSEFLSHYLKVQNP